MPPSLRKKIFCLSHPGGDPYTYIYISCVRPTFGEYYFEDIPEYLGDKLRGISYIIFIFLFLKINKKLLYIFFSALDLSHLSKFYHIIIKIFKILDN